MITPKGVVRKWSCLAALAVAGFALAVRPICADDTASTGDSRLDAVPQSCDGEMCCPPPKPFLYFQADGLMLMRDVRSRTDVASEGTGTGNIVLSSRDLDSPFQAGAKFTLGHSFEGMPFQIEVSYFALNSWNESLAVRDPGSNLYSLFTNFGTPNKVVGFDNNSLVAIAESSYLDNGELNVRQVLPMPPSCVTTSFLFGVRHVGLHEGFNYISQAGVNTLGVHTRTLNDMWGPQIGGLFEFYSQNHLWLNCEVKGALCNNSMSQETQGTFTFNPNPVDYQRSENGTAFVADVDVTVVYRPWAHVTTRLGYQALWMSGLALASRNFGPDSATLVSGPAWLDTQGVTLYHGPHAGVELSW